MDPMIRQSLGLSWGLAFFLPASDKLCTPLSLLS